MKLTVVGCAGSYPTPESPASCYLVQHDGASLVFDMGNGSLGQLQRYLDPVRDEGFQAVVLSHCHIDHFADVGSLYVMRRYGPPPTPSRLPVFGPAETTGRIVGLYGMSDAQEMTSTFDVFSFPEDPFEIGPFAIRVVRARHPVESYSIRVDAGGRSLTYSGDTGPNPALTALAAGTDIALFEASFVGSDNVPDLHMSGADAARAAEEAGAGLLVLTHQVTWNDPAQPLREAAQVFGGPVESAHPGMTVSI